MRVLHEKPPIWEEALRVFRFHPSSTFVFAWGDIIYSPNTKSVSMDIFEHEGIHSLQQEFAGGPQAWWDRYFTDPEWRLEQEIEAYGAQYRYARYWMNPHKAAETLRRIAIDLSSSMYGSLVSYGKAIEEIERASLTDVKLKYAKP